MINIQGIRIYVQRIRRSIDSNNSIKINDDLMNTFESDSFGLKERPIQNFTDSDEKM